MRRSASRSSGVDWGSNCGNCSSVIGLYAVRNGWVPAVDDETVVRVHNTNTGQLIMLHVRTPGGVVDETGTELIPGVPFPGISVQLSFVDPAGVTTGALFPSGSVTDTLDGPDGPVEVTLIDAGAPVVIVPADAVGLTGNETPSEMDARPDVLALLEDLRRQGAVKMALAADKASAARAIPKLALVAEASGDDADLTVRMASMGKVHPALAITGSVALTMAAREPGSVIAQRMPALTGEEFRMATPAGVVTTWTGEHSGAPFVRVLRTTRRLAEATLILPDREVTPAGSSQHRSVDVVALQRSAHTRKGWWRPMNHSADSPSEDTAATPPSSQVEHIEHPPVDRKVSVTIMAVFIVLAVAAVVFGGNLLNPASSTTDGDYAGETVEVLIPLAEGGGTDTWARFVGTELTRTIPGTPGFKPVNEAGGEGISGTNRFVASAKDDGTELLVSTATTVVPWVLGRSEVTYDFDRLTPILANGTGGVIYGRTESGIKSPEDLINRSEPLTFGGISATGLDLTTLVVFDLLGADVESIFGFEGRGPVNLALQRGEVDLDYQTTSAYGASVEGLVKDGDAVATHGVRTARRQRQRRARPQLPRHPHRRGGLPNAARQGTEWGEVRGVQDAARPHLHVSEGDVGPARHATRGGQAAARVRR